MLLNLIFSMSTIFTNDSSLKEQPTKETTQADSWLRKRNDVLYSARTGCKPVRKYSFRFKQKVINEVLLGKCKTHVAEKYHISYKTLAYWMEKACEPTPETKKSPKTKRYPLDFKQKVVSEVRLGLCKAHAAEKYNLSYKTLVGWMRKACLPVEPIPETKEEGYPLDFKQKVISEVCSGQHISQVCKSYNICQSNLNIWLKEAYSPNFPYNSSAAWIDEL